MKRAGLASALVGLLLSSCAPPAPAERPDLTVGLGDLDAVRERGVLRVLVPALRERSLPRQGAPDAEDRDLAIAFADRLGVTAEFIAIDSRTDLFTLLEHGFGDIVTAQLTVTASRQKRVRFTRPTATVSEWLVGKRGEPNLPRRIDDLDLAHGLADWPIHVRASSAFTETLTNLSRQTGVKIRIVPVDERLDTETIAYEVSQGQRPLTVRVPLKHRLRFALAAYNAGWGHLEDARRLAEEKGWDRNKWFGHTERAMLLLRQPKYYRRSRHGYVRGFEPVSYVSQIQNRYDHYVTLIH